MIKTENLHPNNLNSFQVKTDINFRFEFLHLVITQAMTLKRPIDHNIDDSRSNQSMITEKVSAQ